MAAVENGREPKMGVCPHSVKAGTRLANPGCQVSQLPLLEVIET